MSEDIRPNTPNETGTEETSYVPASVYQRVWAMTGVVYMLMILAIMTYFIATGTAIQGITGLLLFPALGGFSVNKGIQAARAEFAADRVGPAIWCALAGVLSVVCLIWGIVRLIPYL